jgi:citrate synthase
MRGDAEQKIARPRQLYQGAGERGYLEMAGRGGKPASAG